MINQASLQSLLDQINRLAAHPVTLVAVSKTQSSDTIRAAFGAGQKIFGENYLQEALEKQALLSDLPIEWHFIGPIQSNKSHPIAEHFSWVHSIDREKIARRLSEARLELKLPPLNICLQVNLGDEASKSGVPPNELETLARSVSTLPGVKLRGLMAIPEAANDPEQQRERFRQLRSLKEQLETKGIPLDTLSMGMSGDFREAVMEGATMVRIGTALFGART
jgi:pyridoxal phosphate enzyme (YggS family)